MNLGPETFVLMALQKMKLKARKLPESDEKTPDILVETDTEKVLIEVKAKFDDPQHEKEKEEVLTKGEVFSESYYMTRQNTISKVIKEAVKQLNNKKKLADFFVVWLVAVEQRREIKIEQFESSLYGSVDTFDMEGDGNILIPCFYFENSEFYNHRNILDASIISDYRQGKLCVNDYSARYSKLKESAFYKAFGKAVLDPIEYERQGKGYRADTSIDRNNSNEVLSYIQNKYRKPRLLKLNMGYHSGSILV
ncbi:MAG: hypothetical protein ACFFDT_37355 [Candidatus Hodarchaeota archaeon]